MIESDIWQNIPGTAQVRLYPILRKPTIVCSNAFIFRTPSQIIILDPGGDPEQVENIEKVVRQVIEEENLPVNIFLTHTHVDHFCAMSRLLGEPVRGRLFCHPLSGTVLQDQDAHHSLAYLYGIPVPRYDVHSWFFNDRSFSGGPGESGNISLEEDVSEVKLPAPAFAFRKDSPLPTDRVRLGGVDTMEVFHTPGHSMDTLSFRLGNYLFVGDVPFAADPGIAGVGGWSSEALSRSIRGICELLDDRSISLVFPSHGIPWPAAKARKILVNAGDKLNRLGDIHPIDRVRLDHLLHYADVLLDEAGTVFSTLAGRLLKVHHYLDELGEEEAARSVMGLMDFDGIDGIIHEFHTFMENAKGSGLKALTLQKAIHFVNRLNSAFKAEGLDYLVSPSFLRRTKALFTDFINAVSGTTFHDQETFFNLNESVKKAVSSVADPPFSEQALLDSIEDDALFVRELTARIAHNHLFDGVVLDFYSEQEETLVNLEPFVLEDMLISLLEEMAARGCRHVRIVIEHKCEQALLFVDARDHTGFELSQSREEYLRLTMARQGVLFRKAPECGRACFTFEFRHWFS